MYEKNYTTSYKKKLGEIIWNLFAEENEKVNAQLKDMRDELKKLEDVVKKEREAQQASQPKEEVKVEEVEVVAAQDKKKKK